MASLFRVIEEERCDASNPIGEIRRITYGEKQ
jgi:hypothetical protein